MSILLNKNVIKLNYYSLIYLFGLRTFRPLKAHSVRGFCFILTDFCAAFKLNVFLF